MPQKDIHEAHKHISLTNQQIIGTATNLDVTTPSSIKAQHKQLPTINNTTLSQILLCSEDVSSSRDALFGSVAAIADSLLLAESMSVDLSYLLENVLCSSLNQVIIITVTQWQIENRGSTFIKNYRVPTIFYNWNDLIWQCASKQDYTHFFLKILIN